MKTVYARVPVKSLGMLVDAIGRHPDKNVQKALKTCVLAIKLANLKKGIFDAKSPVVSDLARRDHAGYLVDALLPDTRQQ